MATQPWQKALNPNTRWLVLVDLESTCSDKNKPAPGEPVIGRGEGEVIEIGAVVIDLEQQVRPRAFRTFVRPVGNPILTGCCTGLTGITQHQVDAAPSFREACAALASFLAPLEQHGGSWAWASWGRSDLDLLNSTAARHGIAHPLDGAEYHDLKAAFAILRGQETGLIASMDRLAVTRKGRPHRALSDACNLARFYPYMCRYGQAQAAAAEHLGIEAAQAWMRADNPELGGHRPAIILHNDDQLAEVLEVIETLAVAEPAVGYAP